MLNQDVDRGNLQDLETSTPQHLPILIIQPLPCSNHRDNLLKP